MVVQVSTRIDKATKQQFEKICESIGISPSSALSMLIKGVINYNGIPFDVAALPRNDQFMAAKEDGEHYRTGKTATHELEEDHFYLNLAKKREASPKGFHSREEVRRRYGI